MNPQNNLKTAVQCPDAYGSADDCDVCNGFGALCPAFVATHPNSPVTLSAYPSVKRLAVEWAEENPLCEICGEPAGAGGALCPVHLREAGIE